LPIGFEKNVLLPTPPWFLFGRTIRDMLKVGLKCDVLDLVRQIEDQNYGKLTI
jgi:hypothetical protein